MDSVFIVVETEDMKQSRYLVAVLAFITLAHTGRALAQGTMFTYQGRLTANGNPANGHYDFIFDVFGAPGGGIALAGSVGVNNVTIAEGLFTVALNFGAGVFDGNARWLEIQVRTNGVGSFTLLSPRQALLPTPYAIH